MTEPRVHIVDDDEAMRDSLKWLLESHGLKVDSYPSAEAFLQGFGADFCGCLVLDVRMPGMNGLDLHQELQARASTLPVIFITGHGDVPMAVSALKNGAADFIEKPFNDRDMLGLIESCMKQDRAAAARRAENASVVQRLDSLTQREHEVLGLIVAGKLNKQIADELRISIKTVEVHRSRVMEKIGAESVAELVRIVLNARAYAESCERKEKAPGKRSIVVPDSSVAGVRAGHASLASNEPERGQVHPAPAPPKQR
jgi:FixJ family two-component response regulator